MMKDNLLKLFKELQARHEPEKAKLENDILVNKFVSSLFNPNAWNAFRQIILPSLEDDKAVYYANYWLDLTNVRELINKLYSKDHTSFVSFLSLFYDQFKSGHDAMKLNNFLKELADVDILIAREIVEYCPTCDEVKMIESSRAKEKCIICNNDLWMVTRAVVNSKIRDCILNGYYLELYTKYCLEKCNFTVVGLETEHGKVSTSIIYDYGVDTIESDVIGISNITVVFCECTTTKLIPNYFRQKKAGLDAFKDFISERLGVTPDWRYIFITTDRVDKHVPTKIQNIEFFEEGDAPSLVTKLQQFKKELA